MRKQTASTFRLWLDSICIHVNTLNNVVISFLRASRLIWTSDSQLQRTSAVRRGLILLERTSYPFQRHAAAENPSAWPETKSHVHVPSFSNIFSAIKTQQSQLPVSPQMQSIWTTSRWRTPLIRQRSSASFAWWNDWCSLTCCSGF